MAITSEGGDGFGAGRPRERECISQDTEPAHLPMHATESKLNQNAITFIHM